MESHVELVTFDAAVYTLDVVKRALYRFTDRCSPDISVVDSRITCKLAFKSGTSPSAAQLVVDEIRKEVLDQDLRRRIAAETEPLRNTILGLAFSNSKVRRDE